jgi:2-polyprenyl-3-methyl-5-hydroxy-6-metoxy-1,4-benzoquinol methylase
MGSLLNKMRPKDLFKEIQEIRERSANDFISQYEDRFITIDCPACGCTAANLIFNKYGYQHQKCSDCQTVFTSPRPDNELLNIYYSNFEAPRYWTQLLLSTDSHRKALQFAPRVQAIMDVHKKHAPENSGLAVDIGAGSGAFALAIKDLCFFKDVIAIDLEASCVEACIKNGLSAFQGSVDTLADDSVDLITLNDIIEHISDPVSFLSACRRALKRKGIISIATPNGEGFDIKIMQEKAVNVTPPEHLNYFNPVSITTLLERAGFDVLQVTTPGLLDVDIVKREVMHNNYDLQSKNEYLQYILFDSPPQVRQDFQSFLSKNFLSSHMLVCAIKA